MFFYPKTFNGYIISLPNELEELIRENCQWEVNETSVINEENDLYLTEQLTETFRDLLLYYIDTSQKTDAYIYKKAYIDRRLFSKIRSDENYHPSFKTVTLLALALELSTEQYEKLLHAAAYSLPDNRKEYIVLRYCFDHQIYDFKKINTYLFATCKKSLNSL